MSSISSNNSEMLSQFVSSLGCTWNSKDCCGGDGIMTIETSSPAAGETIKARTVSIPSFCMNIDNAERKEEDEDEESPSLHSKISKAMSRKVLLQPNTHQEQDLPGRNMLENVMNSFDDLVDARTRAYTQILSNHIDVLRNSGYSIHNERGALVAEYKLQTLLDIATNDSLFDSITTKFKVLSKTPTINHDTSTNEEEQLQHGNSNNNNTSNIVLPIEMIVEIGSDSLQQSVKAEEQEGSRAKKTKNLIVFTTSGEIRATPFERISIGCSDDNPKCPGFSCTSQGGHETGSSKCLRNFTVGRFNAENKQTNAELPFSLLRFESIRLDIDCELLLQQMIKEASNVVSLAVDLTNRTWANNTKMHQEIESTVSLLAEQHEAQQGIAANAAAPAPVPALPTLKANIIVEDDDDCFERRRQRIDSIDDSITGIMPGRSSNAHIVRQESSFCGSATSSSLSPVPGTVAEEEDEDEKQHGKPNNAVTMKKTATFTNLDVVDLEIYKRKRKLSKDLVSLDQRSCDDESASSLESRNDNEPRAAAAESQEENFRKNKKSTQDVIGEEDYNEKTIERACCIVDSVFAGEEMEKFTQDMIRSPPPNYIIKNKRLRLE